MRKILIIMIGLFLIVGTVGAITVNQFTSATDKQIRDYLVDNMRYDKYVMDKDDGVIYFYYHTKTLKENFNETTNETSFNLVRFNLRQSLKISDVKYCLDKYSGSVCWNNMVENYDLVLLETVETTTEECDFTIDEDCVNLCDPKDQLCLNNCEVEVCNNITTSEDIYIEPVWYQLKKQAVTEYNDLKELRDSYSINEIKDFTDAFTETDSEVTL